MIPAFAVAPVRADNIWNMGCEVALVWLKTSDRTGMIESISAVTLATHDMLRAVRFYGALGFEIHGGSESKFTSFRAGTAYLIHIAASLDTKWSWWGRVIFYHSDIDLLHATAIKAGYRPDTTLRDAAWGERFFHITAPDGHELSFAWPLERKLPRIGNES